FVPAVAPSMTPACTASPDGRMLAIWEYSGPNCVLEFWNLNTCQCLARTPIPSGLGSGRFSPDGRRLVLYSVPNKAASLVAFDPATARVLWQVRGAGDYQETYPFSAPPGRAVIGFRGAQLAWRDVTTGNVIPPLPLPLWVSDLTTLPACMFQRT